MLGVTAAERRRGPPLAIHPRAPKVSHSLSNEAMDGWKAHITAARQICQCPIEHLEDLEESICPLEWLPSILPSWILDHLIRRSGPADTTTVLMSSPELEFLRPCTTRFLMLSSLPCDMMQLLRELQRQEAKKGSVPQQHEEKDQHEKLQSNPWLQDRSQWAKIVNSTC